MDKPCHFEVPLKVAVAVDGSGWQWPPGTQPLCCIDSLPRKQSLAVLLCNGCLDLVMPLGDHIPGLNSDKLNVSMFFWRGVIIYIAIDIDLLYPFIALKQQAHQDGQGLSVPHLQGSHPWQNWLRRHNLSAKTSESMPKQGRTRYAFSAHLTFHDLSLIR